MRIPASFGQKLLGLATFCGPLAREDDQGDGLTPAARNWLLAWSTPSAPPTGAVGE